MDKSIATNLGPFVHNIHDYAAFTDYNNSRVQRLYEQLAVTKEIDEVRVLQGQLKEVKKYLYLKESAEGVLKNVS